MAKTPATPTPTRRTIVVRIVSAGAVLFTLWHVFATFLWIAPVTPLRDAVRGDTLRNYMLPWYGQSWSVFAPEPINGDYYLSIRAIILDENGEEQATEWVSATDVETSMAHHNLFPPRAAGLAIKQSSQLKDAWQKLTPEQQELAKLNYYKGDSWLGRLQVAMDEAADNTNKNDVVNYIVQERYTDAYATQVAKAVWGDKVVQVQYESSRQNIIPFDQRNNPDAERPAPTIVPLGWRGLITLDDQSTDDFAETFLDAYDRSIK